MIGSTETDPRDDDLFERCRRLFDRRPLIVGSNRGPLEFHLSPEGVLQPRRGSGAIVTALSSLTRSFEFSWVASAMGEGDRRASEASGGQSIRHAECITSFTIFCVILFSGFFSTECGVRHLLLISTVLFMTRGQLVMSL